MDGPWRVIFICHSPNLNGGQRMLANFILSMDRSRIDPVCLARELGPGTKVLEDSGIPVFEVPFHLALPLGSSPEKTGQYLERIEQSAESLSRAMVNLEADLVLVNTSVVIQAVLAAHRAGLPCAVDVRGVMGRGLLPELDPRLLRIDEATLLSAAQGLIAHSQWTQSFITETYGIPAERIKVIPNGIDVPEKVESFDSQDSLPKRFVVLTTIEPNKNLDLFLDAAKIVIEERSHGKTEFHIYGGGPKEYSAPIQHRISRLPLKGRCFLHSRVQDIAEVYNGCLAAVVPSFMESFSNVCVEAMAYGRPVIATRCGGPEEIIELGQTGFLVDFSAQEMAERMLELLKNSTLAAGMGKRAHEVALERFNLADLSGRYAETLAETCERYWSGQGSASDLEVRLRGSLVDMVSSAARFQPAVAASSGQAAPGAAAPAIKLPQKSAARLTGKGIPISVPAGSTLGVTPPIVRSVRFDLSPERDGWLGLRLMFGTHNRVNTSSLRIAIYDAENPATQVCEEQFSCESLQDNEWIAIRFSPLMGCRGKHYILEIEGRNAGPANAVSLYEWQTPPKSSSLLAKAWRQYISRPRGVLHAELFYLA